MNGNRFSVREEILISGLDDWVYESWIVGILRRAGIKNGEILRAAAIGLIAELISTRKMIPGSLAGGEHVPWGGSPGDAVEQIVQAWLGDWGDDDPTPGAIVWLDNTASGDSEAVAALARQNN